jgi:hypothetical protein
MPFNDRETATILAALRYWQARTPANPERARAIEEIATDGRTLDPLDEKEIDTLCEAINVSRIEPGAVDDAPPSRANHACADQGLQVSAEILSAFGPVVASIMAPETRPSTRSRALLAISTSTSLLTPTQKGLPSNTPASPATL